MSFGLQRGSRPPFFKVGCCSVLVRPVGVQSGAHRWLSRQAVWLSVSGVFQGGALAGDLPLWCCSTVCLQLTAVAVAANAAALLPVISLAVACVCVCFVLLYHAAGTFWHGVVCGVLLWSQPVHVAAHA